MAKFIELEADVTESVNIELSENDSSKSDDKEESE